MSNFAEKTCRGFPIKILHCQSCKLIMEKEEYRLPDCECSKTVAKTGSVCTFCRDQNIRDFNYIQNVLDMYQDGKDDFIRINNNEEDQ